MDPTQLLIEIRNSFTDPEPTKEQLQAVLPTPYSLTGDLPLLTSDIQTASEETVPNLPPDSRIVDVDQYEYVQTLKDYFEGPTFEAARNAANPAENLRRSIFMDRAGVKIANIDAVYNLTSTYGGIQKWRYDGFSSFVDIASGPGAFTQYLQWRLSESMGVGMTLKTDDPSLDWKTNLLEENRIDIYYGEDGTGNLYTNWKSLCEYVLSNYPLGVNLVTGDGGFEVAPRGKVSSDPERLAALSRQYRRQEFLSSRLLLTQILVAINCLGTGFPFMVKVFDTVTTLSAQLIFILACCFKDVIIFKPISSRPANAERYIICREKIKDTSSYSALLDAANEAYGTNRNVTNLFSNPLTDAFLKWLREQNQLSVTRQEKVSSDILFLMAKSILPPEVLSLVQEGYTEPTEIVKRLEERVPANQLKDTVTSFMTNYPKYEAVIRILTTHKLEIPSYDLNKAFVIWNIPDNPLREESRCLKILSRARERDERRKEKREEERQREKGKERIVRKSREGKPRKRALQKPQG